MGSAPLGVGGGERNGPAPTQIRHEQGTRFVDMLLSGVPLDDRPIGFYRRPEEINALWDKSQKQADA